MCCVSSCGGLAMPLCLSKSNPHLSSEIILNFFANHTPFPLDLFSSPVSAEGIVLGCPMNRGILSLPGDWTRGLYLAKGKLTEPSRFCLSVAWLQWHRAFPVIVEMGLVWVMLGQAEEYSWATEEEKLRETERVHAASEKTTQIIEFSGVLLAHRRLSCSYCPALDANRFITYHQVSLLTLVN